MAVTAAKVVLAPDIARGIEKALERHFENGVDLERVERKRERRLDPRDHRRDAKTRRNVVLGQAPEQPHAVAREADLLFGLAQRRFFARRVLELDAAARKADLA